MLFAKPVRVGKDKLPGVIGAAPTHLLTEEDEEKIVPVDKLYIDIGAKDKEEAEGLVGLGDFVAFDSDFRELGGGRVKAKALDDRAGCAAIIELLKSDIKSRVTAIFTTMEEVGGRGSAAAANRVEADLYIVVEGTVCADTNPDEQTKTVTTLGGGPVISLVDRRTLYPRRYIDEIAECAQRIGLPYQYRRTGAGGTDAGMFHAAKSGTPVIGLAVPCRYIHSPVSVMDMQDYENLITLLKEYIEGTSTLQRL